MFVIMSNDYPEATASTLELAEHHKSVIETEQRAAAARVGQQYQKQYLHIKEVPHIG